MNCDANVELPRAIESRNQGILQQVAKETLSRDVLAVLNHIDLHNSEVWYARGRLKLFS
jgi:hypothetical protein